MDIIHHDIPEKQCPTCEGFFPITTDHFHRSSQREHLDGLSKECRTCATERLRRNRANPDRKQRVKSPPGYKYCPECKETKLATPEYFRVSSRGLVHVCILCWKPYVARLAQIKRERGLAQGKKKCTACHNEFPPTAEYFFRDGEWLHSQCHTCRGKTAQHYQETHREELNAKRRKRGKEHREKENAWARSWRKNNPDLARVTSHNWRAHKKEVPGTHTPEQIQEQLKRQHHRCYYAACGFSKFKKVKGEYKFIIEHTFPLSRVVGTDIPANDISYLVLSCKSCNSSKGNKFPWEWTAGGRLL